MATASRNGRTPDRVRAELEAERRELAEAVDQLREELGEATDVAGRMRSRLPAVAAGALGAGFFLAGGVGATMRFLARKGRER
jgi:hypothetical protein